MLHPFQKGASSPASLILRESDPTFALSKMVLLGQIKRVMNLCVK